MTTKHKKQGEVKEAAPTPAPAAAKPSAADVPRLWTVADVAKRLVVTQNTVYKMARRGALPYHRINARNIRFDPAELAAFLASSGVSFPTVDPEAKRGD